MKCYKQEMSDTDSSAKKEQARCFPIFFQQIVAALELLYNIDYVGIVRIECYSGLATGWRDNTVSG